MPWSARYSATLDSAPATSTPQKVRVVQRAERVGGEGGHGLADADHRSGPQRPGVLMVGFLGGVGAAPRARAVRGGRRPGYVHPDGEDGAVERSGCGQADAGAGDEEGPAVGAAEAEPGGLDGGQVHDPVEGAVGAVAVDLPGAPDGGPQPALASAVMPSGLPSERSVTKGPGSPRSPVAGSTG